MSSSDAMLQRDSYFHNCWLRLKSRRKDVWEICTEIEIEMAGLQEKTDVEEEMTNAAEIL